MQITHATTTAVDDTSLESLAQGRDGDVAAAVLALSKHACRDAEDEVSVRVDILAAGRLTIEIGVLGHAGLGAGDRQGLDLGTLWSRCWSSSGHGGDGNRGQGKRNEVLEGEHGLLVEEFGSRDEGSICF